MSGNKPTNNEMNRMCQEIKSGQLGSGKTRKNNKKNIHKLQ